MKISPVFPEQDGEQLDLLSRPHLRFLLGFDGLRTGDGLGLTAGLRGLGLWFFLG